jgi:pimeloyl-ACP methyl ester carboxylesterase
MQVVELGDGRLLAYEQWGDPAGVPVMFQHGTGDSRLARFPDDSVTASMGVRLITVDRPGVGASTPKHRRTLLDWAPDAAALADSLGLGPFAVAGWSGGVPHALAIAYGLGDRVTRLALASALAPLDEPGGDAAVRNRDLRMIWKLRNVKFLLRAAARYEAQKDSTDLSAFVGDIAKEAPADAAVLGDPLLQPMFEEEMGQALAQGSVGVLDDMWAFLEWGFQPEDIAQHVELFHGRADEIISPEMSRLLAARLPDCTFHLLDGGHYTIFAHWREFLSAVR